MKRHWKIPLTLLAVTVLGIACWWGMAPREPSYQGKMVSEWFGELENQAQLSNKFAPNDPAALAIDAMGKAAVPFLMYQLESSDSPLRREAHVLGYKASGGKLAPDTLGPKAYFCLSRLGPQAEAIVPDLIVLAKRTNSPVTYQAISLLGKIHSHPEIAVSALEDLLKGSSFPISTYTATALGEFGLSARRTVPTLVAKWKGLSTQTAGGPGVGQLQMIQSSILINAIRKIDPDAAANAGIK